MLSFFLFQFSILITAATIFTKKTIQYYYNLKYNTYSIASLLLYFTFNTVTINYNYTLIDNTTDSIVLLTSLLTTQLVE